MNLNPIDRAYDAARSVGGYISTVAREARDIPTAIGTIIKNNQNNADARANAGGFGDTGDNANLKTQIVEVGKAALTGKPQTSSQKSAVFYNGKKNNDHYTDIPTQRKKGSKF
jgi:hypothetical protein